MNVSAMTYQDFVFKLKEVFDHSSHSGNASCLLLRLCHGNRSIADRSVDFWTLAADAGVNEVAQQGVFLKDFNENLNELAARDEPASLSDFVTLTIRLDNWLHERHWERVAPLSNPPAQSHIYEYLEIKGKICCVP